MISHLDEPKIAKSRSPGRIHPELRRQESTTSPADIRIARLEPAPRAGPGQRWRQNDGQTPPICWWGRNHDHYPVAPPVWLVANRVPEPLPPQTCCKSDIRSRTCTPQPKPTTSH